MIGRLLRRRQPCGATAPALGNALEEANLMNLNGQQLHECRELVREGLAGFEVVFNLQAG
jgi:hypothetical protein